jgi:hypothetical protein
VSLCSLGEGVKRPTSTSCGQVSGQNCEANEAEMLQYELAAISC